VHRRNADELLVDPVVIVDVCNNDFHKVIGVATHAIELPDLGQAADAGGERGRPFLIVFACSDRDEDRDV